MISYYGDFAEDDTVLIPFNTFSSNDPSASVTVTTLVAADIKVHKDGGTTQIVTDGATIAIDYDTITGNHLITIDTSASADYSTGSEYAVRIEGATVDAGNINAWVGAFSIERAGGALALIKAGNVGANVTQWSGTNVATPSVAGVPEVDLTHVAGSTTSVSTLATSTASILTDTAEIGTAGAGLTDLGGMSTAMKAQINVEADTAITDAALATAANLATVDTVVDGIQTDLSNATDGLGAIKGDTAAILIDTADMQPKLGTISDLGGGATIGANFSDAAGATFATTTDSLEALRNRGDAAWTTGAGGTPPQLLQSTTIATLASQTSFTLTAGSADDDAYNNAIAVITDQSTAVQKCVATISDYVGSTKTVTLAADPAVYTMATGDTIEIIAALGSAGSAPTAGQVADAVWDEVQSAHVGAGTFGEMATEIASVLVDTAEIGAAGIGLTDLGGMSTAMKAEINVEADTAITDAALATAANLATVDTVVDGIQTDLSNATDGLGAIKTDTAAILIDTAEIGAAGAGLTNINLPNQTMDITGSITGNLSGSVGSVTGTVGGVAGTITTLDALDTAQDTQHGTTQSAISTAQADLDTITGSDGATLATTQSLYAPAKASDVPTVAQILTTQMTESYAADGSAPTLTQALMLIQQQLGDFSITGTTLTVRKIDGASTAGTFTLDDGTNPTDITRAT